MTASLLPASTGARTTRPIVWRYHFTDFRTGRLLATLPLSGVTLGEVISGASDASGTLSLLSEAVRGREPLAATVPRRTCMWAVREEIDPETRRVADTRVMWGGVVMARSRSLSGHSLKLKAVSWASYFQRRLTTGRKYEQADKFEIMRGLVWAGAQQIPAYDEPPPATPEQRFPPVLAGTVTQAAWDALYAAGWRERPEVEGLPSATRAALLLAERARSGGQIFEDLTWHGAPRVVGQYNDVLGNYWYQISPGTTPSSNRPAFAAAMEKYAAANPAPRRLYHPSAPATPKSMDPGDMSRAEQDAYRAAGWATRDYEGGYLLFPPASLSTYVIPAVPAPPPIDFGYSTAYPTVPPHLSPLADLSGPLSGILADRTYLASDLKPLLGSMKELAASGYGFDWRLVPYMATAGDLNTFRVRLDLGYPRLGRVRPPDLKWSTDRADLRQRWGHVSDLTVDEDGSAVHNRLIGLGAGTGPEQIRAVADTKDLPWRNENASGYPLYEASLGSGTNDDRTYDTVYGKARGALFAQLASEVRVGGIKVRGDLWPTLPSYEVGDDVTIKVGDETGGAPLIIVGQLVARTISPSEAGRNELVALDVQGTAV